MASSALNSNLPPGFDFMYEPFSPERPEFRLLQIHALSEVPVGPTNVRCTLSHWEVGPDYPHHPEYTALSYTWGAAEENTTGEADPPLREILVNGRQFPVGSNLYDCLCELRTRINVSESRSMYIWIDAICIDQFNVHERSMQIGLMGNIYRNASRVIAWLGKADASYLQIVQPVVAGVTQMVRDFKVEKGSTEVAGTNYVAFWQAEKDHTDRYRRYSLPDPEDNRWSSFWLLLARRWFKRSWVIQEVVLARRITYYCGSAEFSYDQMFQCADLLWWEIRTVGRFAFDTLTSESITCMRNTFLVQDLYTEEGRYKFDDRVILVGPGRPKSAWTFLANLLYSSRRHQATDSKDKVYALLGLITTKRQLSVRDTVSVDYEATTAEVYTSAVRGIILDTSWLGILVLVEDNAKRSVPSMPSYVPDFSVFADQFGIGWQVLDSVLTTMSDLTQTAPDGGIPSFSSDLLQITATSLGTITHTTGPILALLNSPDAMALLHNLLSTLPGPRDATLSSLARCLLQGDKRSIALDQQQGQTQDLTASFLSHMLLQALIACKRDSDETSLTESQPQAWAQLNSNLSAQLDTLVGADAPAYVSLLKRDLNAYFDSLVSTSTFASTSSTPLSHLRHLAEPFSQIFAAHGLDRSVFVTREGTIGTAPPSVKEGDGLWLVARAPCCLVLREISEDVVVAVGEEGGEGGVRNVKAEWERGGIDERRGEGVGEGAELEKQGQEQKTREVSGGESGDTAEAEVGADDLHAQPSNLLREKGRRFIYVGWAYVHDLQSVVGESSRAGRWERIDVE